VSETPILRRIELSHSPYVAQVDLVLHWTMKEDTRRDGQIVLGLTKNMTIEEVMTKLIDRVDDAISRGMMEHQPGRRHTSLIRRVSQPATEKVDI